MAIPNTDLLDFSGYEQGIQIIIEQAEREMRIRNFSPATIKSYKANIIDFIKFCSQKQPVQNFGQTPEEKIKQYLLTKQLKGLAGETINLHLCAITFACMRCLP